ncbi:MAG: NfeD family protein [Proteobacteria bacterium]|nr:NfeD family protein [Pseudomonadota bacterium]
MNTFGSIITAIVLVALLYQVLEGWAVHRSLKRVSEKPLHGEDSLLGVHAEVVEPFKAGPPGLPASGRVRLGGELWEAQLAILGTSLPSVGDTVRVTGTEGLLLWVECR